MFSWMVSPTPAVLGVTFRSPWTSKDGILEITLMELFSPSMALMMLPVPAENGGTVTVKVASKQSQLLAMGTVIAAGTFVESTVRYVQITNLDDSNFVQLTFRDENGTEFAVKLDAGKFFIYNADNSGGVVDTMIAAGSALSVPSTFADLVDITAIADTGAVDIELFVASV